MKKIAVIDQGTSSSKLHIFEVQSGEKPREILRKKIETRLGQNLDKNNGFISEENLTRSISALKEFLEICRHEGSPLPHIVSTEILRKAKNSKEVCEQIKNTTSLNVEILDHDREAEVFWHGATADFTWDKRIAAIDIGGGSVQFMFGTKEKLEHHELLKTGTVFLRNTFFKEDKATPEEYEALEKKINEEIAHINYSLESDTPLIHGSSSVLNFYREAQIPAEPYLFSETHPLQTKLTETEQFYKEVRFQSKDERNKYFPSEPTFMDGACPGLINVLLIAKKVGLTYELPSNFNIIEGIVNSLLKN